LGKNRQTTATDLFIIYSSTIFPVLNISLLLYCFCIHNFLVRQPGQK